MSHSRLTPERLKSLIASFPQARIAVLGDFFLDKYLTVDAELADSGVGPALGVALHTVRTGRFLTGLFGLCAALVAQLVGAVLTTGVIAGTMPIAVASFVLPVFTIYGIRREFRGMPGWE